MKIVEESIEFNFNGMGFVNEQMKLLLPRQQAMVSMHTWVIPRTLAGVKSSMAQSSETVQNIIHLFPHVVFCPSATDNPSVTSC